MNFEIWRKRIFVFLVIGAIQYVLIGFICMLFYPGGTNMDPNVSGYSFFSNYLSDLGRTKVSSGKSNLISFILSTIASLIFSTSYLLYFVAMPPFFKEKNIEKVLSIVGSSLGVISCVFLIGIAFAPLDIFPYVHFLFVVFAFAIAFFAAVVYTIVTFLNKDYPKLNALAYLVFSIAIFIYILTVLYGPAGNTQDGLTFQCTAQKIIIYIWMSCLVIQGYGSWKLIKS